jgi:transposase-like protein
MPDMAGKITGKSQKGQQTPDMTEAEARAYVEKLLWPNGEPTCRHCGSVNAYRMQGRTCRPGLCRCRDCQKQFTVTVGTIFEDSHLPLSTWVKAIHQMSSSKKGMSALQLQRNLGLGSYKTAWFLAHRIRLAMRCNPVAGLLKGDVQCDETYVGANRHGKMRGTARCGAARRQASAGAAPARRRFWRWWNRSPAARRTRSRLSAWTARRSRARWKSALTPRPGSSPTS